MDNIKFTKMHGLGNDYIYIDCRSAVPDNLPALSVEMSDRHFGVGSDGIITIESSAVADFKMRIFNADGSEAMMCGNGIRCVGKYVYDSGLTDKTSLTIETLSGIKILRLHVEGSVVASVTVDMGQPVIGEIEKPVATSRGTIKLTAVSMGNPHGVTFVDDTATADVAGLGNELEHHPMWPDRANIEFARVVSPRMIEMRVWERGSGETMACGTGACATAVAAIASGRCLRRCEVGLLGGALDIFWDENDNHVYMTGPATKVYDGEYIRI
jgi:diaminopimelate epimerase